VAKNKEEKLTLGGTLRYLWRMAKLHVWPPEVAGTRNWKTIENGIWLAAEDSQVKRLNLGKILFVPEMFGEDEKGELNMRRQAQLGEMASRDLGKERTSLMFLVAEYEAIVVTPNGHNLIVKQMPGFSFQMQDGLLDQFNQAFANELLTVRHNPENVHLMIIALFKFNPGASPTLTKMDCMLVNENWLPFENDNDKQIIDELTTTNRRFHMPLRSDCPRPNIILTDAVPSQTALYIIPAGVKKEYYAQRTMQAAESRYLDWYWEPANSKEHRPFPISRDEAKKQGLRS
jgi:hypothetical protein